MPKPIATTALAITLLACTGVMASDGQYWRVGAIWEDSANTTFLDRDCDPQGRAALFGCVDGDDGRPIGARGNFGNSLGAQLAWGTHIGEMWRAELEVAYQPGFDFRGNANFLDTGDEQPVEASIRQIRAGVNVYLDLAAAFARDAGTVAPYVGAGASAVRNRANMMTFSFPELENQPALTRVPCDSSTRLGWMVTAGAGIELSPRNVLDFGVSWHNHGRVQTSDSEVDIVRGGESVARVEVGSTSARFETLGVMLAWRHYIR